MLTPPLTTGISKLENSESARREVLGRLLALNHARHEAEVKAGLHVKGKGSRQGAKTQRKKGESKKDDGQITLF